MVLLPLVGVSLGLRPATIGLLVATGYTADLVLFPISGAIMDRVGRLAAMVPAYGLLAIGLFCLFFAESAIGVLVAGLIMGLGNGLSAGSLFTLGSDVAPEEGTGSFLSAVSVLTDSGRLLGPLLVGLAAGQWGLDAAAVMLGATMLLGLLWLSAVVGETGR
jgi:MFS family permease